GGGGGGPTIGPVTASPEPPVAGQSVTITYDPTGRNLASATSVNIHYGYNGSNWTTVPGVAMTKDISVWKYTYTVPTNATTIATCFNNTAGTWDSNGGPNWNFSVTSATTPTNPPAVPTGLTAQGIATNTVSLSWDSMVTASGYMLYRDGNLISSSAGTSYLDGTCLPDTTYQYTLTAANAAGSSAPCLPVSATTYFAALSNYYLRLVNPGSSFLTPQGTLVCSGQSGLGLTNGLHWSNSLNGQTGSISFTGLTNSSGWAWSNSIALGQGSNRIIFSASYQPPALIRQDSASNSSYVAGWTNGSSGGSGFGSWGFSNTANAGFFLAGTNAPNMNVNSSNGFGLYASSNGVAQASRNLPAAMKTGESFSLRLDNNWINNGSRVGMALANSSGSNRFSFYFIGGESNYRIDDATNGVVTAVPYSGDGWLLNFELTGSNSYRFTAGTNQITGNLGGSGSITQLVVSNNNSGPDTPYNLYVGDMTYSEIQSAAVTQLESPVVFYNPITQGIPDSWWIQYFGSTTGVSSDTDSDGDGFTNLQEYALGTDPTSATSTFKVGEITRSGNTLTVSWVSVSGKSYQIQTRASLSSGSWADTGFVITAGGTTTSTSVSVPADATAYFVRVSLVP
ncbi:MAG: carbohydrate-binding protein, partial [Verrucomicrobia bacterium]|nr:carbohydrate-binding protein [Verrucomicrobiota bacterium]